MAWSGLWIELSIRSKENWKCIVLTIARFWKQPEISLFYSIFFSWFPKIVFEDGRWLSLSFKESDSLFIQKSLVINMFFNQIQLQDLEKVEIHKHLTTFDHLDFYSIKLGYAVTFSHLYGEQFSRNINLSKNN